ncbi:hypothetical protein [Gallaecimonas sp. GXIMD4217]|uniref:hypothetical protein n=1 Tax=Gallaecimonas sp. GXIMD4217 TaxID=3131927 RepID=UPI00311AFFCD
MKKALLPLAILALIGLWRALPYELQNPVADIWLTLACWILSALALLRLVMVIPYKDVRGVAFVFLAVILIPWIIVIPFVAMAAIQSLSLGYYPVEMPLDAISDGTSRYRLYQTNYGATTDFGLSLREETLLPLGLMRSKKLYYRDHSRTGSLKFGGERLQLTIDPYGKLKEPLYVWVDLGTGKHCETTEPVPCL